MKRRSCLITSKANSKIKFGAWKKIVTTSTFHQVLLAFYHFVIIMEIQLYHKLYLCLQISGMKLWRNGVVRNHDRKVLLMWLNEDASPPVLWISFQEIQNSFNLPSNAHFRNTPLPLAHVHTCTCKTTPIFERNSMRNNRLHVIVKLNTPITEFLCVQF